MNSDNPLETPVQFVLGVGSARAELLEKKGIQTVEDLLWFLPKAILDLTEIQTADNLKEGVIQTIRGVVVDVDGRNISNGRTLIKVLIDSDGQYVTAVWFNQQWVLKTYFRGQSLLVTGKPKKRGARWEINHPQIKILESEEDRTHAGILPQYSLTEGLKDFQMRRITKNAVEKFADTVPEYLAEKLRTEYELKDIKQALRGVHTPQTVEEYQAARWRILFDDLLEFQIGLALKRRAWRMFRRAPVIEVTPKIDARIRRLFPFNFTEGQNQAIREIVADLNIGYPMHRLLQADVGGGKTAVAVYAILSAIAAGYQAAFMAPTEVLANQHWRTIERMLIHSRVERLLLTGRLTSTQRQQALKIIREGTVQLVVGTQAVIQHDVRFQNLGLAVIDEQHKFGVQQRSRLTSQGEDEKKITESNASYPHILVMTATPIPRSLCLTLFGDLDISLIQELPPGRQTVITKRIRGKEGRQRTWEYIKENLAKGRQAFVICPRVEEASAEQKHLPSAEEVFRELSSSDLTGFRVGLVHGQMKREVKEAAMQAFRSGETQVLVSTTVVEVGVDVPNATLMVVHAAEQFGLSQLHQIRGRISRGKFRGHCFLFSETESEEASRRMWELESTADGFRIAEADFKIRGPGDILGTRQHGQLPLRVANLQRDSEILDVARRCAKEIVNSGEIDNPFYLPLKLRVMERFGKLFDIPQSG